MMPRKVMTFSYGRAQQAVAPFFCGRTGPPPADQPAAGCAALPILEFLYVKLPHSINCSLVEALIGAHIYRAVTDALGFVKVIGICHPDLI